MFQSNGEEMQNIQWIYTEYKNDDMLYICICVCCHHMPTIVYSYKECSSHMVKKSKI